MLQAQAAGMRTFYGPLSVERGERKKSRRSTGGKMGSSGRHCSSKERKPDVVLGGLEGGKIEEEL